MTKICIDNYVNTYIYKFRIRVSISQIIRKIKLEFPSVIQFHIHWNNNRKDNKSQKVCGEGVITVWCQQLTIQYHILGSC